MSKPRRPQKLRTPYRCAVCGAVRPAAAAWFWCPACREAIDAWHASWASYGYGDRCPVWLREQRIAWYASLAEQGLDLFGDDPS